MATNNNNYGADQIQVLEGLDPVRMRPGMYIGSTGQQGLHHLVTEIVNNSMDEAMAGFANKIKVVFLEDGSVAVYDNGRGIPFGIKKEYGVSALELAFTRLHAGGKFGGDGYKVTSGLHGVGASVVNALSEWCRVIVIQGNDVVMQEYQNGGKVVAPVDKLDLKDPKSKIKNTKWSLDLDSWKVENGTIVHFKPDATIFETVDFKLNFFLTQLREYAYLTSNIKFEIVDKRINQSTSFYFEGGIKAYIKALNRNKKVIHETIFHTSKEVEGIGVEVAFQYNDSFADNVITFANHLRTSEGGTHLTGFRTALTKLINDYGRKANIIKEKDPNLSGDDLREGLTAIVSVRIDAIKLQYEGQTKGKLGTSDARSAVETATKDALELFLEENPRDAQNIIEKNLIALKARMAAKAARDTVIRKSAMDGGGVLPGKLADCASKDIEKTELFIVEGDSAGGSAKQARSREFQAILPIFGKLLNTERARVDKIADSDKLKQLVIAIGTGIGETFNHDKLRYGKLIIMADADTDGQHISTLYLTFFFRHMRQLLENGRIFMAQPPLFKASWNKEKKYLLNEIDLGKFLQTDQGKKAIIQRFKGLGEMSDIELWETTMNPETRFLKQVNIDDAARTEEIFTTLMGEEVAPRKRFIQTHAKEAQIDLT